ncbi:DUF6051 family protein [Myroides sp. LJL116]
MHYFELYQYLKELYNSTSNPSVSSSLGVQIQRYDFTSLSASGILLGGPELFCTSHQKNFTSTVKQKDKDFSTEHSLNAPDFSVKENLDFPICVMRDLSPLPSTEVIVLFHGLNEKRWDKYLPWGYELVKKTGKAVVFFPISFHMERAPLHWSDRKLMFEVANQRATDVTKNADTSYVNAAISTRMQEDPSRLFWSGLQTFYDFLQWIEALRQGKFHGLDKTASIDLFGYSIGSFLAIILKLANPKGILTNSKLVCFCGGMTIDRMFPVSKYIMDAKATIAMQKVFAELLTTNFASNERLAHYQCEVSHPVESWFKAMLRYNHFQEQREDRLRQMEDQIYSINLLKDEVAPPVEALNMLQGPFRDIGIKVDILDYPFKYSHMLPFSLSQKEATQVDEHFNNTMQKIADFYNKDFFREK